MEERGERINTKGRIRVVREEGKLRGRRKERGREENRGKGETERGQEREGWKTESREER